jgi:outer membrane protein TolC
MATAHIISQLKGPTGAASRYSHLLRAVCLLCVVTPLNAQVSFTSAIDLALRNSPRIKMAEDDVDKALATLSETKDVFVPSIIASGGAGASSGITLNVPTIFTVSAQSVVFNYSQRDYIRSAHMGVEAAELALKNVFDVG